MDYRYLVVEGSIGSGKTALSRKLAQHFECELLSEAPEQNPFLTKFYLNAANHGLATQLHFLMERAAAASIVLEEDRQHQRVISDFLLEKDQIFVPIVLQDDEATLYWQIKQQVLPEYPVPDLVIYLQGKQTASHAQANGSQLAHYKLFPNGYMAQVDDEYSHFFHLYTHAPLLIANTDELDFINNDEHFQLLLSTMQNMRGSRHYLNLNETTPQ